MLDPTVATILLGIWMTVGMILVALLLVMLRLGRLERQMRALLWSDQYGREISRLADAGRLPGRRA